jgi:flagellar motor switch/type III secretory pathway protein FliN
LTAPAWSWLPDGALLSPSVIGAVDAALEAWSRRWFQDFRLVRQRLVFSPAPSTPPVAVSTGRVAVRVGTGADDLAGRALDMDLSRLEMSEDDEAVVAALREALLQDLAQTLDSALAGDGETPGARDASGAVCLDLTDEDGRRMAVVETSRSVLAGARLAGLPARARRAAGLTSLRTALADVPVRLFAQAGSAAITLPEARRLAPGDVIVLDQKLDEAFDLVAENGGAGVACVRLVDTASPRSLQLEAAARRSPR